MTKLKKGDHVTVIGKRWRDQYNTYHSCVVYVNSKFLEKVDFDYGYGDGYIQTAKSIIEKYYQLPIDKLYPLSRIRDYGINLVTEVSDVKRRKDL